MSWELETGWGGQHARLLSPWGKVRTAWPRGIWICQLILHMVDCSSQNGFESRQGIPCHQARTWCETEADMAKRLRRHRCFVVGSPGHRHHVHEVMVARLYVQGGQLPQIIVLPTWSHALWTLYWWIRKQWWMKKLSWTTMHTHD